MYDILLKGGLVADPLSLTVQRADVAVAGGSIAEVAPAVEKQARETIDCGGLVVQPGIIDTHLHATLDPAAYKAVAYAGVTSCIDMMGPVSAVTEVLAERGCGLNVAVLEAAVPGRTLSCNDPKRPELEAFISRSLESGAFGVKLLGGHFPLTPDASAELFASAARLRCYAAWHAGTTEKGSNIEGMEEAVALLDGHPAHLAHINAYCRGYVDDVLSEFCRASALLEAHPEIVSESYVSDRSGGMVSFDGSGLVASHVMRRTLARFGYGSDRREVSRAIRDHVLQLVKPDSRGSIGLVSGDEGVEWLESHPGCGCAFDRVNPFSSRVLLAAARRSDGTFLVDAISTDGGAIARNVILEQGLCIQKLAGMTLAEFALKTSLLPARMLGLEGRKGHFTPGADADVTVYDPVSQKAVLTLVEGRKVLFRGTVAGQPGRVICTEAGRSSVEAAGLEAVVVRGGIPTLRRRP